MNKSLYLITLFFGLLIAANRAEATVDHTDAFKGIETLENSPWDPREETKPASDDSGKDVMSEESEASADE